MQMRQYETRRRSPSQPLNSELDPKSIVLDQWRNDEIRCEINNFDLRVRATVNGEDV